MYYKFQVPMTYVKVPLHKSKTDRKIVHRHGYACVYMCI